MSAVDMVDEQLSKQGCVDVGGGGYKDRHLGQSVDNNEYCVVFFRWRQLGDEVSCDVLPRLFRYGQLHQITKRFLS